MLTIKNLHAEIEGKKILNGINLQINAGEVHAIMGPNGSGKSTLAHVLAGREGYEITEGSITYMGKDLLELSVDERAKEGIFQAFQYPIEIPGVSTANFLKHTINAVRKHQEKTDLSAIEMLKYIYPTLPSKLTASNFCASTANSIGNSLNTSLQYPLTIRLMASSIFNPLCIQ